MGGVCAKIWRAHLSDTIERFERRWIISTPWDALHRGETDAHDIDLNPTIIETPSDQSRVLERGPFWKKTEPLAFSRGARGSLRELISAHERERTLHTAAYNISKPAVCILRAAKRRHQVRDASIAHQERRAPPTCIIRILRLLLIEIVF